MVQFRTYWPDCPYKRYIVSNELEAQFEGFENIRLGKDRSWSDNLARSLVYINEDYVLLFLEDLFLRGPVNRRLLGEAMEWVAANEPAQIKLNATERPDERVNGILGRVVEGAIYRTSTVLTLWNKQALVSLLRPGESAWDFEIAGSERSDAFPNFFSLYRDCFPVVNGVIKGKWRRPALRLLASECAPIDLNARSRMTFAEELGFRARELRSLAFKLVPMRFRRRLRSAFVK